MRGGGLDADFGVFRPPMRTGRRVGERTNSSGDSSQKDPVIGKTGFGQTWGLASRDLSHVESCR